MYIRGNGKRFLWVFYTKGGESWGGAGKREKDAQEGAEGWRRCGGVHRRLGKGGLGGM